MMKVMRGYRGAGLCTPPESAAFIENLAVFSETSQAFERWLVQQGVARRVKSLGIRVRSTNRIHTKVSAFNRSLLSVRLTVLQRFGVPINAGPQSVPDMTQDEFYDTCAYEIPVQMHLAKHSSRCCRWCRCYV